MEYINKIFIQYFNMIFNMYYFIMHVDYMREYKHVSYTTCRWYTTCLFVQGLGKPNIWRIQHFDVQFLWMSTFCWQQWDQHLWFIAAVTSSTDRSIFAPNTSRQQFLTWASKMATLVNIHDMWANDSNNAEVHHRKPWIAHTGNQHVPDRELKRFGPRWVQQHVFWQQHGHLVAGAPNSALLSHHAGDRVANNPERQHDVSSLGRTHHESNTVHSNLQHVLPRHRVAHWEQQLATSQIACIVHQQRPTEETHRKWHNQPLQQRVLHGNTNASWGWPFSQLDHRWVFNRPTVEHYGQHHWRQHSPEDCQCNKLATTHLCPFNRWLDLNMDGTRPSSTAWSTPECKHSTGCQHRFNSIWTRSRRTNILSNKAFNFHTGGPRHQSVFVATQRSWNLSMPTPTWLSTTLISTNTMEQQEKMPTWMKRRRVDPTWDQQVGETATSLTQQPKTTEMMMSATGSPTPESTDK